MNVQFELEDGVSPLVYRRLVETCVESHERWGECARLVENNPRLRHIGAPVLHSVATISLEVRPVATRLSSDIPAIISRGYAADVRYIAVHIRLPEGSRAPRRIYPGLADIIGGLAGVPAAVPSAPGAAATGPADALSCAVETACRAFPGVSGILAARIEGVSSLSADLGERCISYCVLAPAGASGTAAAAAAAVVQGADETPARSEYPLPERLPMLVSSVEFMARHPVPLDVLRHVWGEAAMLGMFCTHPGPGPAARHYRRHVYFRPGLTLVTESGWSLVYDWCQLIATHYTDLSSA
ncbi:hypothetical protein H4R18_004851 [Coemansia javaensis]|uniref:Uncharacterized protein n=1 Tax=Coemansia javaensis TaxID=2761396 RepID=A0A9W8LFP6_9FUNG|nr:hypothetical protein H4R18_004851 [Coemansia javaensis]